MVVIKLPGHGTEVIEGRRERLGMVGVVAGSALAWLIALGGLVGTISDMPKLGWHRTLWVAALCVAGPAALWLTRRATAVRRIRVRVPAPVLQRRTHGRLEAIIDSERRALRSITATAYEVAECTDDLLADLMSIPNVRIFHGVRPAGADLPLIPHAICAGRSLLFVESVAWPAGCYETHEDDRIHCDGTYIGQSVRPLLDVVRHWRAALPRRSGVSAMVVVHPADGGDITLPAPSQDGLTWVHADHAAQAIRQHLPHGKKSVSRSLVAELLDATADRA